MNHAGCRELKWTDRLILNSMLRDKVPKARIAKYLGVCRATIYNEIARGWTMQMTSDYEMVACYCPETAQKWYEDHLDVRGTYLKIGHDQALSDYLEDSVIREKYSPAAALARAEKSGKFRTKLCTSTVYNYVYRRDMFRDLAPEHLPHKGKRHRYRPERRKAARAPAGESIERRPAEIKTRGTFGHWEMDTVVSGRKGHGVLLVLTERKTRYELIILLPDGTAKSVVKALDVLERKYGKRKFQKTFRSITCDNGVEFSDCEGMQRSRYGRGPRTKIYYCHPYSAHERGSNENTNGLIRRFFPKGTDFSRVTKKAVQGVQDWLNHYPRRILGWKTAEDMRRICMSSA